MLQVFAAGSGSCLATVRTQLKEELTQLALHLGPNFWPVKHSKSLPPEKRWPRAPITNSLLLLALAKRAAEETLAEEKKHR